MGSYIVGVDLGSTSAECVVINEQNDIVETAVVETGTVSPKGMQRAIDEALEAVGADHDSARAIAATGYGRRLVPGGADFVFTEISAHGRGVAALFPGVRLVIDIGGQDTKVMHVDQAGRVERFAMNDRCASGTGRFYEGLAHTLETEIESLDELVIQGRSDLEVSALCANFAITDVIALLARGHDPADIAASVHKASAARALGLVGQVGKVLPAVLTGGVARNAAMVRSLSEALGAELLVPENPQITGAYGAAILAAEALTTGGSGGRPTESESHQSVTEISGVPRSCATCNNSSAGPGTTTVTVTAPSGRVV